MTQKRKRFIAMATMLLAVMWGIRAGRCEEQWSVQRYEQLAERGHVGFQELLARWYDEGHNVPQDLDKAAYWYTRLAESEHAEAMCVLGRYYEIGRGVAPDMEKSVHWHTKAAEHGWLPSLTILRRFAEGGDAKAGEALARLDVSDRIPLPSADKDMWVYTGNDHQHGQCQVYIRADTIRYGASGDHGCYGTASAKSVDNDGNLAYEYEYRFAWSYDNEHYPLWFYSQWRNGYHIIHGTSLTNLQAEAVLVYMLEHDPNPEARQIPLDGWSVERNEKKR